MNLQKSSYVPIGRPEIIQTRPVPPPTPIGTSYQSKQNELAEIRKTQESLIGRAPSVEGTRIAAPITPPVVFSTPISVPSIPSRPVASVPTPSTVAAPPPPIISERPTAVVSYLSLNIETFEIF